MSLFNTFNTIFQTKEKGFAAHALSFGSQETKFAGCLLFLLASKYRSDVP